MFVTTIKPKKCGVINPCFDSKFPGWEHAEQDVKMVKKASLQPIIKKKKNCVVIAIT